MSSRVIAHKRTVGSGKALADALGLKCITPKNTKRLTEAPLINYGVGSPCPTFGVLHEGQVLNPPMAVHNAVNKARCLRMLTDASVPCLEFTSDPGTVYHWLTNGPESHRKVFWRTKINGSKGDGITVIDSESMFMDMDFPCNNLLFTRNYPKTKEYRVHVAMGKVLGMVQKRAMSDEKIKEMGLPILEPDRTIRTYANGWVFSHELTGDSTKLEAIKQTAVDAVAALGLDFGAVDMLAKGQGNAITGWAVCEVNSAPSLDGETTIQWYRDAFKEVV